MTVSYVTFMKHAQKVTKATSASRPVLKGVYHAPDGSVIVTDSHRLYVAKGAHSGAGKLIDPKTGEAIDGNYPDVSRLIPDNSNAKYTAKIDVGEAVKAFEALLKVNQVAGKGNEIVDAISGDGEYENINFIAENTAMSAKYMVAHVNGTVEPVSFNTVYMLDALKLFKDAGVAEVTMRFFGSYRPFTLSAGNDDELLALILPIRRAAD